MKEKTKKITSNPPWDLDEKQYDDLFMPVWVAKDILESLSANKKNEAWRKLKEHVNGYLTKHPKIDNDLYALMYLVVEKIDSANQEFGVTEKELLAMVTIYEAYHENIVSAFKSICHAQYIEGTEALRKQTTLIRGKVASESKLNKARSKLSKRESATEKMLQIRKNRTAQAKKESVRIAKELWEDDLSEGTMPTAWGRVATEIHEDRGVYLASLMGKQTPPAIATIKKWIRDTAIQYNAIRRGRGDIKK